MLRSILVGLLGAVLLPPMARASATELVQPASWPASLPPRSLSREARPVSIDLAALGAAVPGERFLFDPDRTGGIDLIVDRVERRSRSSVSVACRLEADPDGFALFCLEGDAVAALIQVPSAGSVSRIGYLAEGVHELAPTGRIPRNECATDGSASGEAPTPSEISEPLPTVPRGACPPPTPIGHLMIYYTPSARAEAGGVNAMNAECQLAVDVANQTYVASLIGNRLSLVYRGEISYTESGALQTDRDRLTGTSDGFIDFVHGSRDVYGADFVSLFVRTADASGCGIAFCTPSGAAEGFCVVDWTCASSNFTLAHEIGHLQGCAHNREDAGSGCNQECFSYGHRFSGSSGSKWRTVMAYDTDPGQFTRIGQWSNPDVLFDGQPSGVWTGNCADDNRYNAATVSNTALNRESWRNPRFDIWVLRSAPSPWLGTFARPFPSISAGVAATFGGTDTPALPVLHLQSTNYPEALTLSKRMLIVACGGSALIGG